MRFSSERSARNTFVAEQIDRAGELREQPEQLLALQQSTDAVELLLSLDLLIATQNHGALHLRSCVEAPELNESRWYLGRTQLTKSDKEGWRHYFVRVLETSAQASASDAYVWSDLRLTAASLSPVEAGFAAFARGLQFWHSRHRFCSVCGSPSIVSHAGHRRVCVDPQCAAEHFPRTDPAIIVAVEFDGAILLGRQASWPPNRYSTLAGFVEPGESLEDAVRREVFEEAGVRVLSADYHSSQPWPFPASLMLGFSATAASMDLQIGPELEDARWFSLEEFESALFAGALKVPPSVSVSYRLIEAWYEKTSGRDFTVLLANVKAKIHLDSENPQHRHSRAGGNPGSSNDR